MRPLLALLVVCSIGLVADAQVCVNGVCYIEQRPALAPLLPSLVPAVRSVLESQPIRRVATAPVRYMNHRVVQPPQYYSRQSVRVYYYRRNFR